MSVMTTTKTFLEGKNAGPLAAIALELARRLDDPDEGSPAPVAKELRATLDAISDLKAEKERTVDPLAAARSARVARKSRTEAG